MASLMKIIEKDMHHYILALLLAIFIITDIKVPSTIRELIDTLLGKVILIGGCTSSSFRTSSFRSPWYYCCLSFDKSIGRF